MKVSYDYIAGFFDGDGCVSSSKESKYEHLVYWNIAFTNTNREVLESIRDTLELSREVLAYEPKPRPDGYNRKTRYILAIQNRPEFLKVAKILVSRSIVKREKLKRAIKETEANVRIKTKRDSDGLTWSWDRE